MTESEKAAFQQLEQRVAEIEAAIKSKSAIPFNDFAGWAASNGHDSKLQIGPTPETMVVIERMQIRILKVIGSVFALIGLTIASIILYSYFATL